MTMADTRQKLLVGVLLVEVGFFLVANIEQWNLACPTALCCSLIMEMQQMDDAFHCDSDNRKVQNILGALRMKVNFQEK